MKNSRNQFNTACEIWFFYKFIYCAKENKWKNTDVKIVYMQNQRFLCFVYICKMSYNENNKKNAMFNTNFIKVFENLNNYWISIEPCVDFACD